MSYHLPVKLSRASSRKMLKAFPVLLNMLKAERIYLVEHSVFRLVWFKGLSEAVAILSVRLSVPLSVRHTHALWQNQRTHCGYFDIVRKGNHSRFLTPTVVHGWRLFPSEICAQSDPPPSKHADFDRFPPITSQP